MISSGVPLFKSLGLYVWGDVSWAFGGGGVGCGCGSVCELDGGGGGGWELDDVCELDEGSTLEG